MTRPGPAVLLSACLVLGLLGVSIVGGLILGTGPGSRVTTTRGSAEDIAALDDLLLGLQIVPLGGRPAPSFTLDTLDGTRVALADLAGRPALLYFWATW
jgi:cytochrome oxidase Cu insertion factor (SCO1/SenC/PrrC family)